MEKNKNLWVAVIAIYLIGSFAVFNLWHPILEPDKPTIVVEELEYSFDISAEGAYVFDISENKEIYDKNANTIFPFASITKVMTAIVALEELSTDLDIVITKKALGTTGDNGLLLDEVWDLEELVKYMLIASSNDAAVAIEEASGIDMVNLMNEKAKALGMDHTVFRNVTGLETIDGKFGGEGTPKELSILFKYALKKHFNIFGLTAKQVVRATSQNKTHIVENTNINIDRVPGLLMSKTGFTDVSKGSLAIVYNKDIDSVLFITVLGSTFDGRFDDIQTILEGLQ